MAIKTDVNSLKFHTGRGNVSGNVAKSTEDVLHEEAELVQDGMEPTPEGGAATDHGNKPIFATGEMPFQSGRGLGRGHGPETK